jgi:hypothetical protein
MLSLSEKSTPCRSIRPRRIASRLHPALQVAFVQYAYRSLTTGTLNPMYFPIHGKDRLAL